MIEKRRREGGAARAARSRESCDNDGMARREKEPFTRPRRRQFWGIILAVVWAFAVVMLWVTLAPAAISIWVRVSSSSFSTWAKAEHPNATRKQCFAVGGCFRLVSQILSQSLPISSLFPA